MKFRRNHLHALLSFSLVCASTSWTLGSSLSTGLIEARSAKQLFIDDFIIQSISNAKQILNPAVKHPENPLLKQDQPWEGNYVGLSKLIYEEDTGLFRMWYRTTAAFISSKEDDRLRPYRYDWGWENNRAVRKKVDDPYGYSKYAGEEDWLLCYATSRDGIHWEKPNLGKVDFNGSKENNILPRGTMMPLFRDKRETDPAKRYKTIRSKGTTPAAWQKGEPKGMRMYLYYSPDGFNWTPYKGNPVFNTGDRVGRWGPTNHMGWDPIRKVYAVHMENCLHRGCRLGKRIIGRAESPDMINWSKDQTILVPSEEDYPDTEFYAMPVMAYEGVYIGVPWIFRTTNTLHYPELAFSRDGIHYKRPYRQPLVALGSFGDFDESTIYVSQPFVHEGEIRIYYYGGNWRGSEALYAKKNKARFAVGLATIQEDGFVSVDAGKIHPGELVTRFFTFEGTELFVTMEAAKNNHGAGQPEVRVEILGTDTDPVPGFTLAESDAITTTGRHQISWRGKTDIGSLAGEPIQLRFEIRNAKLFSFQFVPTP